MLESIDPRDKQVIRELIETDIDNRNLTDFFSKILIAGKDRAIVLLHETKEVSLIAKVDDYKQFTDDFMNLVSLIEYLKSRNMIFIIKNDTIPTDGNFIGDEDLAEKYGKASHLFGKGNIGGMYNYLIEYTRCFFFARSELKDYVKHDYKPIEQRRYEKQVIATWAGIGIAFFTGLVGIWLNIVK